MLSEWVLDQAFPTLPQKKNKNHAKYETVQSGELDHLNPSFI